MTTYFYNTISQLRSAEEIVLYDRVLDFTEVDEELVKNFLLVEYEMEQENYPFVAPEYNANAALWAAKVVYTNCQLILYRENKTEDLPKLLPAFDSEIDASAMLSADLCLRFLPQVLKETKYIDPDDKLIELAEEILRQWHYSSIGYEMDNGKIDFNNLPANKCLQQLYVDRVILKKDLVRASLPYINEKIKETMGDYSSEFWKELKIKV